MSTCIQIFETAKITVLMYSTCSCAVG